MEAIVLQCPRENRIEAGDERSEPESRTDQAPRARARAARTESGASRTGADLAAESADAAAGSVLHHAGINAESRGAGFRAQDIGVSDVQVVARDGDIQVVLQRERDGVIERQVELAVPHQGIDARGVGQVRRRQMPRRIRSDRVGKMRYRLRIVQDRERLCFRRILRDGRGGRFLGPACDSQRCE